MIATQEQKPSQAERRIAARWIPTGSEEIKHPEGLGVAYLSSRIGQGAREVFTVLTYWGNAGKHAGHYSYRTREAADQAIAQSFASMTGHKTLVAGRRKEANRATSLKVGDVVVNSWGWEQTNVDSYQVTKRTDHFVWLRPIASENVPHEGLSPMAGRVTPKSGEFIEGRPETKHKAAGEHVSFKHGSSTKWDGNETFYESWYA